MGKGGLGFLDKRHCEKTSFVVAGGIGAIFFLILSGYNPTIMILDYSQGLLSLVIFITIAGYLGVLYYKISKHKKLSLKTLIIFWRDK